MFRHLANLVSGTVARMIRRCAVVLFVLVIGLGSLAATSAAVAQQIVRVDGQSGLAAPSGPNPGDSWNNAYLYLHDGLVRAATLAGSGSVQVWVRGDDDTDGITYYPDESFNDQHLTGGTDARTDTFTMRTNVAIYGGFNGEPSTGFNSRNPSLYLTVLSGDLLQNDGPGAFVDYGDNSFHVVTAPPGTATTAIIDGFTIKAGNAIGALQLVAGANESASASGGMVIYWDTTLFSDVFPHILRCRFTENLATRGAAMFILAGDLSVADIRNCVFDHNGNGNTTQGGAIYVDDDSFDVSLITNSLFYENDAVGISTIRSGEVSHLGMVNCTVTLNHSAGNGAALHHVVTAFSDFGVVNSIVYDNTNTSGAGLSAQISGDVFPAFSCVGGLGSPLGTNINDDPDFVNPANDFHLEHGSPAIDRGDNSDYTVGDSFDLNQNAATMEFNPELDLACRFMGQIDMGAYEKEPCYVGNIVNTGTSACRVDVDDLLAVITQWDLNGCSPPCPADIAPEPVQRWRGQRG